MNRVASVSLDKKDGVKFSLKKDTLNLSVIIQTAETVMKLFQHST